MDREEFPAVVDAGNEATTTCICEDEHVDPALSEAYRSEHDDDVDARAEAPSTPDELSAVTPDGDEVPGLRAAQVIEALLFSSDSPLNPGRLSEMSGVGSVKTVRQLIASLNEKYEAAGLSFRIEEIAKGYQLLTLPAFEPWLSRLNKHQAQSRLTGVALETLSIIAYKQPVIRADIEAIRGVGCGEVLNRLREMGLIKIIGRAEIVGRPMLYGTTKKFLDTFGLSDLDDLPPMESLTLRRTQADSSQKAPEDDHDENDDHDANDGQKMAAGA